MIRTYRVSDWESPNDFLEKVAQKCGKLLKGGEPDINTVSKMILNDWQRGKIPFFVPPPGCEMPPPKVEEGKDNLDGDKTAANDQDFSQIRMSHKFEGDDNFDESMNTTNDASQANDVSKGDVSNVQAESGEENVECDEEDATAKKRKTVKKPKFKSPAKKVNTASGIFEVIDSK